MFQTAAASVEHNGRNGEFVQGQDADANGRIRGFDSLTHH